MAGGGPRGLRLYFAVVVVIWSLSLGAAEYIGTDICVECHEEHTTALQATRHAIHEDATGLLAEQGCEACHGPGSDHLDQDGEPGTIASLKPGSAAPETVNEPCLQCHQSGAIQFWQGSSHARSDVVCSSCHRVHSRDLVQLREEQADACYTCHAEIRAKAYRPYGHPLREFKVTCTQCHNPHGGKGPHDTDAFTVNDNCYTCHAEKRGPFLFEHAPVPEDCTLCHDAHGSVYLGSLLRPMPMLCISCHQEFAGANHVRQVYDYSPGEAVVARGLLGGSCANCHSQVHGSNHPSGVALMR
jgi:DmsE family decaheme c-type cytochrome